MLQEQSLQFRHSIGMLCAAFHLFLGILGYVIELHRRGVWVILDQLPLSFNDPAMRQAAYRIVHRHDIVLVDFAEDRIAALDLLGIEQIDAGKFLGDLSS